MNSLQNEIKIKKKKKKINFIFYKCRKTVNKCIQKKKDHIALYNAVFCCFMHSVKT